MKLVITTTVGVTLFAALAHGGDNFAPVDTRITAEKLGLPKGNARTSEPFVTRIYKTDDLETILNKQPEGYPFTITQDYTLIRERVFERPDVFRKLAGLDDEALDRSRL